MLSEGTAVPPVMERQSMSGGAGGEIMMMRTRTRMRSANMTPCVSAVFAGTLKMQLLVTYCLTGCFAGTNVMMYL